MPPSRPSSKSSGLTITHIDTSPQRRRKRPNGTTPKYGPAIGVGRGGGMSPSGRGGGMGSFGRVRGMDFTSGGLGRASSTTETGCTATSTSSLGSGSFRGGIRSAHIKAHVLHAHQSRNPSKQPGTPITKNTARSCEVTLATTDSDSSVYGSQTDGLLLFATLSVTCPPSRMDELAGYTHSTGSMLIPAQAITSLVACWASQAPAAKVTNNTNNPDE